MADRDHASENERAHDNDAPRRATAPGKEASATSAGTGRAPARAAAPDATRSPDAASLGARQVKAKMVAGAASDSAERDADRAADQVMRMAAPEQNRPSAVDPAVADASSWGPVGATVVPPEPQRPAAGTAPDPAAGAAPGPVWRRAVADHDPHGGKEVPEETQRYLDRSQGTGSPLPDGTRRYFEDRFSADFGGVRVHDNDEANRAARSIGALAATQGSDIWFSAGTYDPVTDGGRQLLAHELAHVVQQAGGLPRAAVDGEAADPLEQAAETAADQAVTSGRVAALTPATAAQARHLPSSGTGAGRPLACQLSHVVQQHDGATAIQRAPEPTALQREPVALQRQPEQPGQTPSGAVGGAGSTGADPWVGGTTAAAPSQAAGSGGGAQTAGFIAEKFSEAEFSELTGLPPDTLPKGVLVKDLDQLAGAVRNAPTDTLPPGVGPDQEWKRDLAVAGVGAAAATPSPISHAPTNSTGIMWSQGHLSVFAKVDGQLTVKGFRGELKWYVGETFADVASKVLRRPVLEKFAQQLNRGVQGGFVDDMVFTKLPGNQSVIYVPVDPETAAAFRDELTGTQINETFRYSPPPPDATPGSKGRRMYEFLKSQVGDPMVVHCTINCITEPVRLGLVERAIGMRPQVTTEAGRLDIATGSTEGGPVDPYERGRAKRMTEFMKNPDLSAAKPGAQGVRMTPAAAATLGVIRVAGGVWLVYGGYRSVEHLVDAWQSGHFGEAVAEEGAGWGGGIAVSELTADITEAIGARVLPFLGGEMGVGFVVIEGGVIGVAGYLGAMLATGLVKGMIEAPQAMVYGMVYGTALFLGGLMDVTVAGEKLFHQTAVDVLIRPLVVSWGRVNPGNWDLRQLPPAAALAVHNLGMTAWSTVGAVSNLDDFRSRSVLTFAELGVPPQLAADASQQLQLAGIRIGAEQILSRRPLDLVKDLEAAGALRFVQDPEVLAEQQTNPEGYKFNEAYLHVRLEPLIAAHAGLNPNNWDLRQMGPGGDAVRQVGQVVWSQLRGLGTQEFDEARSRPMSSFGVRPEAMLEAARAIFRPIGIDRRADEEVPAEYLAENANNMLAGTPEDFLTAAGNAGLGFRSDPAAVARAAMLWVRAGYQAW
jgi:hypothetical protein